ncbi:putative nucleoside-diphosphate sugar epimerase [Polynucleobacter duraquae]|uniref:Nucleoside-diphosphate sugar epimerase n=1 Tax=Polynucleobacter duraquae TaxID=1835254 RepID=A0A0E3ZIU2_9BURK|nr:polysaccharide biosynthesis protein [Polynucleobacter duraquae]AKD24660.1 putative nucleoside-diphosphate sugar epimerase [Polynucleobacter duraquae]
MKYIENLKLSRNLKRGLLILNDCLLTVISFYLSLYFRVGEINIHDPVIVLYFVITYIFCSILFGNYNVINRYLNSSILWQWIKSCSLNSVILSALITFGILSLPRSVGFIQSITLFLFLILSRKVYIKLNEHFNKLKYGKSPSGILIYGADPAGINLYYRLDKAKYKVIAFIDDDLDKQNLNVSNIKILSKKSIFKLLENNKININTLLVKDHDLNNNSNTIFFKTLKSNNISIKVINDAIYSDNIDHLNLISKILERDWVEPQVHLMNKSVAGKSILITGAGGSIGSEICRQVIRLEPSKLLLLDNSEYALFKIYQEITSLTLNVEVIPVLESVCSNDLERIFKENKIDTIFHAAAYKHVGLVECNPKYSIYNNVIGIANLIDLSIKYGILNFTLISTDKAVNPSNIMGLTKRISELILHNKRLQVKDSIKIDIVRFGNVIGSSGSAVEIFKKQIANGGPVTVTHPDVTRYFMSIPEAAQLVIQSCSIPNHNGIFILDMGKPIKILEIARALIEKNTLDEIEIQITGLKKGEKLHEELSISQRLIASNHEKIRIAQDELYAVKDINCHLDNLKNQLLNSNSDQNKCYEILQKIVPNYEYPI